MAFSDACDLPSLIDVRDDRSCGNGDDSSGPPSLVDSSESDLEMPDLLSSTDSDAVDRSCGEATFDNRCSCGVGRNAILMFDMAPVWLFLAPSSTALYQPTDTSFSSGSFRRALHAESLRGRFEHAPIQ